MAFSIFDKLNKRLEWFKDQSIPDGAYSVIRIDGRTFSKMTERLRCTKPFDFAFHGWMNETTNRLVKNFNALYGYHQSDEISVLLRPYQMEFDRRHEKLVSVAASLAGASFMRTLYEDQAGNEAVGLLDYDCIPHFDARVVVLPTAEQVVNYFIWRQQDATRNALNSYCHWTAIQTDRLSARAAGKLFEEKTVEFKNEFLFKHGINFNDTPEWQRRGSGSYFVPTLRLGYNPKTQEDVMCKRNELQSNHKLPMGDEYRKFMTAMLNNEA